MKNVRTFGVLAVGLVVAIAIWASPFDLNNTKDVSVGNLPLTRSLLCRNYRMCKPPF